MVNVLSELPYRPGGWPTVLADPPWEYRAGKATRIKPPYPTMSVEQLMRLPIAPIVAEQALLFLWCTQAFLEDAFSLCRAWGFRPKSGMVWVKQGLTGKLQQGMGSYTRLCHEHIIIGSRGGATGLVRDIPSVILAPRGKHSQKPEQLYSVAERLASPPRLELFARSKRPGWVAWGNQVTD